MATGTSLTVFASNLLLNKLFRNVDFSITAWYVGILVAVVPSTDDGLFVECTGTNYARKAINFSPPASGQIRNSNLVDWGVLSTSWGSAYGTFVADSADLSVFNMLAYGPVNNGPRAMNAGSQPRIAVNGLVVLAD